MLKALFGSEPRVKIISLFFLHPEAEYSLRQIVQSLELPGTIVRREIENLEKSNLLVARESDNEGGHRKTGKIKLFRVNSGFLLYPEIRALFLKAQILSSQKFITNLLKTGQLKLLLMTGLFTNYQEAVTDILIVGRIKREQFIKSIKGLEKDLGREVNFTIMTEKEFCYRQEVMDIFLYNVLEGKNLILFDEIGLEHKSL